MAIDARFIDCPTCGGDGNDGTCGPCRGSGRVDRLAPVEPVVDEPEIFEPEIDPDLDEPVEPEPVFDGGGVPAEFGDVNPATKIRDAEEAEALARFHLASSSAALSLAAEKAAENPGAIAAAGLRNLAAAISIRLNRSADLMAVFDR